MIHSLFDETLSEAVRNASILIVDDHGSNVELLREILIHAGYARVRGECDPTIVPALCEAERYDLLLIDVRMPRMSGFELMERLKAVHGDDYVPILVLTAQTDEQTRRTALALGANDFLTKPFIAWELLHRVRNMLQIRTLYRRVADQKRELEQRVAERTAELTLALAATRRADRAKLDFLSVVSHELRTPLNSIIGFAEEMASEAAGPLGDPSYREYVTLIEESGKVLLGMVNNILDYTRGATGVIELHEDDVPLAELLDECTGCLAAKAEAKGIAVITETVVATVRADRRRLREMVLALLDNAIKFHTHPGRIGLVTTVGAAGVTVRVADDGPGIAPDILDHIFDPFVQGERALRRHHEGIGLGLPIVRRLAELHGGTVEVETRQGEGTTVTILLPPERLLAGG